LLRPRISPRRSRLIRTVSIRSEASLQPAEMVSVRNSSSETQDCLDQRPSLFSAHEDPCGSCMRRFRPHVDG
jgi:hypothetical protein